MSSKIIRAVLAGQPNSGKSTVFNNLTGAHEHVGNYPGITVEWHTGSRKYKETTFELTDLPGTYSLSAYSDEERVARDYIINGDYDFVIDIVDASNLERSLLLTLQLKELGIPVLVVLNMIDLARKNGMNIDKEALSAQLGMPIVECVGYESGAVGAILDAAESLYDALGANGSKSALKLNAEELTKPKPTEEEVAVTTARLEEIKRMCSAAVTSRPKEGSSWSDKVDAVLTNVWLGIPIFLFLLYLVFQLTFTLGEYPMGWIESGFEWLGDWVSGFWAEGEESLLKSLIVDGIIGGLGGVLVFLPNILLLFLAIAFLEDSGYMARAAYLADNFMKYIGLHGKSFVPMIIGFGCGIPAIMATRTLSSRKERLITMFIIPWMSCGARVPIYMLLVPAFFPEAYQAWVMWGLYVLGIIVAIIVAKIMSVFVIREENAPFIIELPPYRFPTFRTVGIHTIERGWLYLKKAGTILLGISIVLWALATFPRLPESESAKFEAQRAPIAQKLDELKEANPELETLAKDRDGVQEERDGVEEDAALADAEKEKKLAELDGQLAKFNEQLATYDDLTGQIEEIDNQEAEEQLANSYSGRLGHLMVPVIRTMGFDWKIGTAIVGALAAKEVFVAQMGVVYSIGEADEESESLRDIMKKNYPPLVGLSILVFCLLSAPCVATFAIMVKEAGWGWAFAQFITCTIVAWVISTLIFQIGTWLQIGTKLLM